MEQPPKGGSVFANVPERINFPKMEEEMLEFWKRIDAFRTSLKKSEGKPEYSFYDGPPFATGLPHYGHLLAGTIKDTVTRYAHMTGHHVTRRFGWDCHGLPIEFEIDKQLGIKVLKLGIDKYNESCRAIVMRYSKEWEHTVNRIGRWIDFENDYKTLNLSFMESVWWVFKQLYEKGLVYRGFKVMPYSTGCTTPLSNFEVGLNYQTVQDPAVTVSFPLVEDPSVLLLAWTTTPWTLPSNLALCVHPSMDYVKVFDKKEKKVFVLMEARLPHLYKDAAEYEVREKFKGSTLKGKKYTPLFQYFVKQYADKAFYVVCDEYVTSDSGTGIVHQAPAFGEDDYRVCLAHNIIQKEVLPCPIDANGRFTAEVTDFVGEYVKDADKAIKKHIKGLGRMIVDSTIQHQYPYCWRSETPLIYRAVPSWFVAVEKIKQKLLDNNKATYWVPAHVREGRFHNWLADAHDWAVSRNRYWGTPLPIWVSDDGTEVVVVGSVAELEELSSTKGITDIHRHKIDHLTIPSKQGKGVLHRVDEVFDCWFESGSMPYAQVHYPFENKELFEKSFPADFIAEGIDQTRGWFYTLLVLSTGLFDKPPFKNLVVNGLVLAADGKKMSKSKKNYPDPMLVVAANGADALRLYLVNSPVVRAENLRFREEGVRDVLKDVFLPWFNAYRFFTQNAALVDFKPALKESLGAANIMDKWILAATQSLIKFVRGEMEAYRLYTVVPRLVSFVNQLTNWYVRLNRKRMKADAAPADRTVSLNVMFEVLLSLARLMAPFTPFLTDYMYQNLRNALPAAEREDSVHYLSIPEYKADLFEPGIEEAVATLQEVVELGRTCRDFRKLTLKLGLRSAIVISKKPEVLAHVRKLESYVLGELNVQTLTLTDNEDLVSVRVEPDLRALGKKLGKAGPAFVYPALAKLTPQQLQQLSAGSLTLTDPAGQSHTVESTEVQIVREFKGDTENFVARGSADVMVVLDATRDATLLAKWYARELTNRIQKARKKAGLLITDPIEAYYEADPKSPLAAVLAQNCSAVEKATRLPVLPLSLRPSHARFILHEEAQIVYRDEKNKEAKVKVDVALAPLVLHFDMTAVKAKYPALSATDAELLCHGVGLLSANTLAPQLGAGKVPMNYNGTNYELAVGKEVFKNGRDLLQAQKK